MRLGIIDCGTNTFNLLILETGNGRSYDRLFHTRVPVKMGGRSIRKGMISDEAMERGMQAMEQFDAHLRTYNVAKVLAYATSAIRDSKNGREFTRKVEERLSIRIEVIDGEREAELIYKGVREAVKMDGQRVLIMDIGGGSTEFIIADASGIHWKHSFRIGAARLLEKFNPSDPITEDEVHSLRDYLEEELDLLDRAIASFKPVGFIGSSGAFESLVEMLHEQMGGEPFSTKTEYVITLNDYRKIAGVIERSTLEERRHMKGLVAMRVDMIVIFCIKVDFILDKYKFDPVRVSAYSLKEGAAVDYLEKLNS
jgi:exopolyphosphatase / guanosine-5'-triphosphate,3'-diphosphate pyrophosphatase